MSFVLADDVAPPRSPFSQSETRSRVPALRAINTVYPAPDNKDIRIELGGIHLMPACMKD